MTPVAGAVKEEAAAGGAGGAGVAGADGAWVPSTGADGAPDGPGGADGPGARLDTATALVGSVVSELEPDRLTGAGATGLYRSLVDLERLVVAGKTLLAPRIEASGIWREDGYRSAAVMLAALEGVSTGQAHTTLANGQRLARLPATEAAVRTGQLSLPKVTELTSAGVVAPEREGELLRGAGSAPLSAVRERCRRSRATSATEDPLAAVRRIRDGRSFSSWTDAEGAFCYQGRDTADRGAQILSRLGQVATRLRRARRAAGEDAGPERAVRADALFALITQRHPDTGDRLRPPSPPRRTAPVTGEDSDHGNVTAADDVNGDDVTTADDVTDTDDDDVNGDDVTTAGDTADEDVNGDDVTTADDVTDTADDDTAGDDPSSLIDGPPTCSVMVRVDLDALLRGHTEGDECCEIDHQGPVPVAMARDLANDSFLRLVFHRAGDIRAVSHQGRTINRTLRTALVHRDTTCVVPGCRTSFGLEIDHIIPFAEGGPTTLDNLALLCHHHHFLKTYEGWILSWEGTGPGGTPRWRFEPQPPFGQEPDLGMDTPEARARRKQDRQDE